MIETRPTCSIALIALAVVVLPTLVRADEDTVDLVVHGVTLVSPERSEPLPDAWVAVRDGKISAVGTGSTNAPSASSRFDGEGAYLIPGLIDAHVHLANVPGLPYPAPPPLADIATEYRSQLPKSYLYFGFTTLIDLNVVDADAIRSFRREPLAPDVYDCGGAIALANGYPMAFLPPNLRFDAYPNFLWDERQSESLPGHLSAERHTPEAAVSRVAESGAICAKAFVEDGFGPVKIWPIPTLDTLQRAAAAATERELTFTVHANALEAHRLAIDAGAEVLVHGLWNWDGAALEDGAVPAPIRSLLDDVVEKSIGLMPTQRVLGGLDAMFDPAFLESESLQHVLPGGLIEWYGSPAGGWFKDELRRDFGGAPDAVLRTRLGVAREQGAAATRYLADQGGRLLFGSDTPSGPTYGNPPGLNGYLEFRSLKESGVSESTILHAATLGNAEAFGLADRYGTIETGKDAHLLLLRENPWSTVDAYDTIEQIVLRGEMIPRSALSARGASIPFAVLSGSSTEESATAPN